MADTKLYAYKSAWVVVTDLEGNTVWYPIEHLDLKYPTPLDRLSAEEWESCREGAIRGTFKLFPKTGNNNG